MDESLQTFFHQAYQYKCWADKRTLTAVAQVNQTKWADAYGFMCQQLNHMVIVEELFKSRLLQQSPPHNSTNTHTVPDLPLLERRLLESGAWYQGYIMERAHTGVNINFVFADGQPGSMTVSEILFHVVNHGSYHRGNIARALDQSGVPHLVDGYGVFIHQQEPARRQWSISSSD